MSRIGKLLGLLTFGRMYAKTLIFQKFLSGIAAAVALTIVSGMMVGTLLIGGLYALYALLLHFGLPVFNAMFTTGAVAFGVTALLIAVTAQCLQKLLVIPKDFIQAEAPLASRVSNVADAFVDGLLTREIKTRKRA